jgi:hypothetical protein
MGSDGAVSRYIIVGSYGIHLSAEDSNLAVDVMNRSALPVARHKIGAQKSTKVLLAGMSDRYFWALLVLGLIILPASALGEETLSIKVSTDKQDYGLGQSVFVTVEVQKSGNPVAGATVYFDLRGPEGRSVLSGFMITDSSGHYTKRIVIGNDLPLGSYAVHVSVTIGDDSASATAVFQTVPEFGSNLALLLAFVAAVWTLTVFRKKGMFRKTRMFWR